MLKRRLIPKLQICRSARADMVTLVTTTQFGLRAEIGSPVSQAKIYQAQAVDELVLLNIEPDVIRRERMLDTVSKAARELFMPLTVGGGVGHLDDFRSLLMHGADKVAVNSAAVAQPDLIAAAANNFGRQCVVVSIDFRMDPAGRPRVFTHSGAHVTGWEVKDWALECERRGAGELLLTSIDRDGMRSGLDIGVAREVTSAVGIPVILAGGCGVAAHFTQGFVEGGVDAVAAGTYFCHQDQSPMQCRAHIKNAGLPIRLVV